MKKRNGSFHKLYKRIYLTLFWLCLALLVLIDATAIAMTISTFDRTYRSAGTDKATRVLNSISIHLNSVETTTYNLAHNDDIIQELTSPSGYIMLDALNRACDSSMKIHAITAYSVKGEIYTSSGILEPPTLADFKNERAFQDFFEGEEKTFLSLRTSTIAKIYNNNLYPAKMGIITYCQKVFGKDELVGYIFSDMLPYKIYSYFSGEGEFDNIVPFITISDGGYFHCDKNEGYADMLTKNNVSGYFRYSARDENLSIVVFESKGDYYTHIAILCAVWIGCSGLVLVAVHFISRRFAKTITGRLDNFLDEMEAEPYNKS